MSLKRLSKFLFATAGAVVLLAPSAGAHAGHTFAFSASSYALNANADFTSSVNTGGGAESDTLTLDMEAGFKLAHDDNFGNELASNPNDNELIGEGSATAAFIFSFCSTVTVDVDVYFEEDMTGAPAGAVAHYRAVAASVGTYDVWAIEENDANDDYKLFTDLNQSWTCSTQPSNAGISLTTYGSVSGRIVAQNPSASDCKVVTSSVLDVNGVTHTGTDSKAFGTSTCP